MKTKLGISVGLFAAILYFSGLVDGMVLFLLAGYALLCEDNKWLRRAAVKAMLVVVIFAVGYGAAGAVSDLFDALASLLNGILKVSISVPLNLDSVVIYALRCLENIMLILLGVKALRQGTVNFKIADNLIDTHMTPEQNTEGE